MNKNLWYLDSDCSKHIEGDKCQFKKFKSLSGGSMTFGDESTNYYKR
jgi:hypothetical protein